jgi:hypothetical protein
LNNIGIFDIDDQTVDDMVAEASEGERRLDIDRLAIKFVRGL